jgi:hypothetical protein
VSVFVWERFRGVRSSNSGSGLQSPCMPLSGESMPLPLLQIEIGVRVTSDLLIRHDDLSQLSIDQIVETVNVLHRGA